jgi:glutamate dehydrogenase
VNEALSIETRTNLLARARAHGQNEPSFGRFLEAAAEATDPEDLALHSPDVLETLWRSSYERLGKRDPSPHRIYFLPPADLGHPEIIEVFSADMPFIVDSVLAAIRARGGTIRFMSHPILVFDPATFRVLERPAVGTRPESFLHIHIDPLPDAETRRAMEQEIDETMVEVARTVRGWRPMLERVQRLVQAWHDTPPKAPPAAVAEGMHFLGWLAEHNFTFLGMREYRLEGAGETARLLPIDDSGLGILEDPNLHFLRSGTEYVEMTEQHVAFMREADPLMVTKANIRARVHRRSHMDYVGV